MKFMISNYSFIDLSFDDISNSPIGGYPRLKNTFTALKNPNIYWDKQGRRNYGEALHEMDNFTDMMGIGVEQSPAHGLKLLAQAAGFVAIVCFAVSSFSSADHSITVLVVFLIIV